MSTPSTLHDLYTEELEDLWSAHELLWHLLPKMLEQASDFGLRQLLRRSQTHLARQIETLKSLLASTAASSPGRSRGMARLVNEAHWAVIDAAPSPGPLLDTRIIAEYQRLHHYGLAGLATLATYAHALGHAQDERRLRQAGRDMDLGAAYRVRLAEVAGSAGAALPAPPQAAPEFRRR